jgi:GAF domain-containing protein
MENNRNGSDRNPASGDGRHELLLEQIRTAYDQFEVKLTQLSILRELGAALLYINDFRRVCQTILKVAIENTVARNCSIMLMDHDCNRLFLVAAISPDGQSHIIDPKEVLSKENVRYTFAPGEGVAGEALLRKASVLVEDVDESEVYAWAEDTKVEIGTLLSAPLIVEKDVLGVLTISHPAKRVFEPETVNLFDIMASFVAMAINSTLNFQRLQYSEEKYRALAEHSRCGISITQDGTHQYANPPIRKSEL